MCFLQDDRRTDKRLPAFLKKKNFNLLDMKSFSEIDFQFILLVPCNRPDKAPLYISWRQDRMQSIELLIKYSSKVTIS
jgi:hypothetical protein